MAAPQDVLAPAGPQAAQVLALGTFYFWLCLAVLLAVAGTTLWLLWRRPRADAATPAPAQPPDEPGRRRGVVLALGLSVLGLLALIVASVRTERALAQLPLQDALHVEVTGQQWWWQLRYDDADPSRVFTTANELHLPVGRPVILTLRSSDVIHSLWLPNLAGKKDLIPGRTATLQLRLDRAGTWRGQCAEFCGLQHAWMALPVVGESPQDWEAWAAHQRQGAAEPADALTRRGREVFLASTCAMCHEVQGTDAMGRKGPTLTHLAGRQTLAAGRLPNTDADLAAWVLDPQVHKPGTHMPAHRFTSEELRALVAYLRSLQ